MSFSWTAVLKIPWYQFRGMCDMELSVTLEFTIRFLLFSLKNPVLCGPCHETGMLSEGEGGVSVLEDPSDRIFAGIRSVVSP